MSEVSEVFLSVFSQKPLKQSFQEPLNLPTYFLHHLHLKTFPILNLNLFHGSVKKKKKIGHEEKNTSGGTFGDL